MTQIIQTLDDIIHEYDAIFCDLWGCLHNGFAPFADAVRALERFNARGGTVLLLTNSPRPKGSVIRQLDKIGVPRDLYAEVASSGDSAQTALAAGDYGKLVYHLGPERDLGFFAGIDVTRVPLDQAQGIVCTGLFDDDSETPEDYRALLLQAKHLGLKMLCANPDVMVDKGDKRIYCAGAIANAYNHIGGDAHFFGKPHAPIYTLARQRLNAVRGAVVPDSKILCVGDGINTDIRGAIGEDLDSLFITGGLAADETGTTDQPDPEKLGTFLQQAVLSPTAAIGFLR